LGDSPFRRALQGNTSRRPPTGTTRTVTASFSSFSTSAPPTRGSSNLREWSPARYGLQNEAAIITGLERQEGLNYPPWACWREKTPTGGCVNSSNCHTKISTAWSRQAKAALLSHRALTSFRLRRSGLPQLWDGRGSLAPGSNQTHPSPPVVTVFGARCVCPKTRKGLEAATALGPPASPEDRGGVLSLTA